MRVVVGDAEFANRTDSQCSGIVELVELLNGLIALVILAFQLALFLLDFANTGVVSNNILPLHRHTPHCMHTALCFFPTRRTGH